MYKIQVLFYYISYLNVENFQKVPNPGLIINALKKLFPYCFWCSLNSSYTNIYKDSYLA